MTVFEIHSSLAHYVGVFAIVTTAVLGLIAYAMAERKKTDGTPFNVALLKTMGGLSSVSGAFWMMSLASLTTQA